MRIAEVVWDDWNEHHISRHRITPAEVEQVIFDRPLRARRMRDGVYALYGRTSSGRYLTVIVAPRGEDAVYVVTARGMTAAERRSYGR